MRLEIAVVLRDISEDRRNGKKTHLGCLYIVHQKTMAIPSFKYDNEYSGIEPGLELSTCSGISDGLFIYDRVVEYE